MKRECVADQRLPLAGDDYLDINAEEIYMPVVQFTEGVFVV
jgi:hypothetical protein